MRSYQRKKNTGTEDTPIRPTAIDKPSSLSLKNTTKLSGKKSGNSKSAGAFQINTAQMQQLIDKAVDKAVTPLKVKIGNLEDEVQKSQSSSMLNMKS